jgi:hypothetical protein
MPSLTLDRGFKGIFIPADLWCDDGLSLTEKCVFAEIDSLDNFDDTSPAAGPGCRASDAELAEFFQIPRIEAARAVDRLIALGRIRQLDYEGGRLLIVNRDR